MAPNHRLGGRARFLAAFFALSALLAARPARAAVPFMVARYGQAAALLPNGKILVVGGADATNTPIKTVEILDTNNGSEFVSPAAGGFAASMSFERSSATITVLPNGNVLITGGVGLAGVRGDAEVYDPTANTWATVAMGSPRFNHTATLLLTGNVLVCGGETDLAGTVTATCELFTPAGASGSFAATGAMLLARSLHSATILNDGTVWVAGGWNTTAANLTAPYIVTTERYTPSLGSWQQAQPLNAARAFHTATLTGDNKVLIAGGYNGRAANDTLIVQPQAIHGTLSIPRLGLLNSTELFDPTGGSIIPGPPLLARLSAHDAKLVPHGLVSIFGGRGNIPPVNLTSIGDATLAGSLSGSYKGTYSQHLITNGAASVPIDITLGTPVSGQIVDGDVEFVNPHVDFSDGTTVTLTENLNNPAVGLRASLKGATVTCDDSTPQVCGLISSNFTLSNTSGTYNLHVPINATSNLPNQGVTGSVNISPAAINLTINSGVASVTGGNFTTNIQVTVPDYLAGFSISSVTLNLAPTATAGWTENSSYTLTLTGGSGIYTGAALPVQVAGDLTHYITIPAFTFTGISGTLIIIADDPAYTINSGFTVPLGLTARLDTINFGMYYASNGLVLTGQTLQFDSVDVIIRDMIFGDNQYYTPSTNNWDFDPPAFKASRPGFPRTGASGIVTRTGLEFDIGGRECASGGCATLKPANDGSGGSRLDQASGTIPGKTTTSDLEDPIQHAFHTATLLPDGSILLAGGTNGSGVLANAEIFDPTAVSFTPTATTMKFPREQHTASLLPNGRVLLAGGFTTFPSTGPSNSTEIYYPDTKVFLAGQLMISSRSQHVAVTLPNGNVFVAGGYKGVNTVTGSAEIYVSTSGTWMTAADMTTLGAAKKRAIAAAAQLQDGRIMLCGGTNEGGILNSAIAYDPATNAWSNLANMPSALQGHTATVMFDGRVLVAGGNDGFGETTSSYLYDPVGNSWATLNPLKSARFGHSANLLPNGTVMISGGVQQSSLGSGSAANALETIEFYLPDWGEWADGQGETTLTAGARAFHTTTLAPNGQLYFIGGADGSIGVGQTLNFYKKYESNYFTVSPDQYSRTQPSLRQSTITTTTADAGPVLPGSSFNITGLRFRGATEASGGSGAANSSFSTPRMMLQKLDGANGGGPGGGSGFVADLTSQIYSTPSNQTTLDTSLTVTLPNNNALPYGWYQDWVGAIDIHTAKAPTFQVGPAKPAVAPVLNTPVVLGFSSVTYSWAGIAPPCDGYNVYSSTTGIFIASVAYAGLGATSFTQTILMPNTTTSVLVAGYTLSGDGPLAASATTYTLSTAPTSVRITSVTFSSLLLQWNSNGNTEHTVFEVSQSTDWPNPFSQSVSTPVPAFLGTQGNEVTINQLLPNTTYSFRLQAYNYAGSTSTFSMYATTATRSNVAGVLGKALSSTSILWSWNDAGPVTYKVYQASSSVVIITTTATTFTETGLGVNTQHAIAVTAITGAGEGPLSNAATTFTLVNKPGLLNPALTLLSTFSFTLGWGANGNPNGTPYNVVIFENLDSGVTSATFTTTGFTFDTLSQSLNLHPSVRYDSYITAFNGEGVPSAPLLISTYTFAARPVFVDPVFLKTTPTTIGLQWDAQGNSTHTFYEVTYSSADPAFVVALTTAVPFSAHYTASSTTLTGLITSANYNIRVRAMNPFGQTSQYSFSTNTVTTNGGAAPGSLAGPLLADESSTVSGNLGDGRFVSLTSPAGAFPSDTVATLTPFNVVAGTTLCPGGFNVAVKIDLSPAIEPIHPVYLTADFDPSAVGSVPLSQIALERYDSSGVCVPLDTTFDPTALPHPRFRARLNHFSTYQLVQIPLSTSAGTARIFPNPYRVGHDGYVTIDQVPPGARVRIMTLRGEVLLDQKANNIGLLNWTGLNAVGRSAASGLYIVLVESGGSKKILKMAVIR